MIAPFHFQYKLTELAGSHTFDPQTCPWTGVSIYMLAVVTLDH